MNIYGEQLGELTQAVARLVAAHGQPQPRGEDLRVALDCRYIVVRTIRAVYGHIAQPRRTDHRQRRDLAALEREPLDTFARLLDRITRGGNRAPDHARDSSGYSPSSPITAWWQHAARQAMLLEDTVAPAQRHWDQAPEAAWKGVADLAALGRALPWLDADLARANRPGDLEQKTLRYSARSGLATAAAAVEALARSGPLSGQADIAAPAPDPNVLPVGRFTDLTPAQHKIAAQLDAAGARLSVNTLGTVAVGQARAALAASRLLQANNPGNGPLANTLVSRARALNEITVQAQTGVTSIHPGRGDQRAAIQTGEIMRFLRAQADQDRPTDPQATAELMYFARGGADVVTALHTAARTRLESADFAVRSHASPAHQPAWIPARGFDVPLLRAARDAAEVEAAAAPLLQAEDHLAPAQDGLNTAIHERLARPTSPDGRRLSFPGPALGPRPPSRMPPARANGTDAADRDRELASMSEDNRRALADQTDPAMTRTDDDQPSVEQDSAYTGRFAQRRGHGLHR